MAKFNIDQVLSATGGQLLVSGASQFSGVSIDTRTLQPGELFVALHGERINGHDFLEKARELGAVGAIVDEQIRGVRRRHTVAGEWTIIEVTDTLYALGQLAQYHRRRFRIPIIGITGSAGKTTTKEMTASILEQGRNVLKSQGNFNNEIGMPLTLFKLEKEHQAAVLEFGMRGRGQIGYLAALAHPTIGVITNIGLTHMELLGSQEEIALAKAELFDEMTEETVGVIAKDDFFYPLLREHAPGAIVTVGETHDCDFWVSHIKLCEDGCAEFVLHTAGEDIPIRLSAPGRHQIFNALAAAAAALTAGATPDEVKLGLAAYIPGAGRMRLLTAPRGFSIIDDTYNANPSAMRATLEFLAEMPGKKRKMAVLGDMRELGTDAITLHREIGKYAMELGIDLLLAVGELGKEYVAGAADSRAQWYHDNASAAQAAFAELHTGDIALVKGSRAMKMEEIVEALLAE